MGVVAVREMARHRYRCTQYVGLTRAQLAQYGAGARHAARQGVPRRGRGACGAVGGGRAGAARAGVLPRGVSPYGKAHAAAEVT